MVGKQLDRSCDGQEKFMAGKQLNAVARDIMAGNKGIENCDVNRKLGRENNWKLRGTRANEAGKNEIFFESGTTFFTFRFFLALASATFFTDLALISFILAL